MKVNLLAITVGNTRVKLGLFLEGKLERSLAVTHDKLQEEMLPFVTAAVESLRNAAQPAVLLASVQPAVLGQVAQALRAPLEPHPQIAVWRADRDVPIAVGRQLDPEALTGEDRLLNAAAAFDVLQQACVVVDAGTALTVDFVDGQGTFHGGAIAPGAQMMLDALHARAAQLPAVTAAPPQEPIGHNTTEAMRSAMYHGLRGLVRELVEQYAQVAGAFPMVVATGGDADLLFGDYDLIDRRVPELTLWGLAVSYRRHLEQTPEAQA